MTDEIMREVRRIRDAYVARRGNSLDAIFADLKTRGAWSPKQQRGQTRMACLDWPKRMPEPVGRMVS